MRGTLVIIGAIAIACAIKYFVAPHYIEFTALLIACAAWIDRKVKP